MVVVEQLFSQNLTYPNTRKGGKWISNFGLSAGEFGIWSFDRNCLKQPLEHVDWGLLCKKWRFLWFFYAIFSTSLGLLVLEGFPKFLKIFIRLAEKAIWASWWRFTVQKAIFSISPGLLVLDRSAWVAKISEKFYQVMRNLKRPLEQVDWGVLCKKWTFLWFFTQFSQFHQA